MLNKIEIGSYKIVIKRTGEHDINLENPTTWLEKQIMKKKPPKSNHRPLQQPGMNLKFKFNLVF